MTMRTFKQKGIGYGPDTVTITAKINGTVVYTGPVYTENASPPPLPDPTIDLGVDMFTWTTDVSFQGIVQLEMTVTNDANSASFLMVTDTLANYVNLFDQATQLPHYLGPDVYGVFYFESINNPEDPLGPWVSGDPFSNLTIDAIPAPPHPTRMWPGQTYWRLGPQQTLICDVNINAGHVVPATYDPGQTYVHLDSVSYGNAVYGARQTTTGNPPTDSTFWKQIGIIG